MGLVADGQPDAVEIPQVVFVAPFRPSAESAESACLRYPALEEAVAKHLPFTEARQQAVAEAELGSVGRERVELELKKQGLLECAWALQSSNDTAEQIELGKKFTDISVEIFGEPDAAVVRGLIGREIAVLSKLERADGIDHYRLARVIAFYRAQLGTGTAEDDLADDNSKQIVTEVKRYYEQRVGRALEAIVAGDDAERLVGPEEIAERFTQALAVLQADDRRWGGWQVVMQDSGSLSVVCSRQHILVGSRRTPTRLKDLPGNFAHEVLVHALRQINANSLGDKELSRGLAGHVDAEEGLAVLVGCAISGASPTKAMHRYMHIAFAMGLLGRAPVPRSELFDLVSDRQMVLDQAAGLGTGPESARSGAWEHVNRIYRGTPGQEAVGVFTKDISYYKGFREVSAYLEQAAATRPVNEVLDFLLACKFNPLDKNQASYVVAALQTAATRQDKDPATVT